MLPGGLYPVRRKVAQPLPRADAERRHLNPAPFWLWLNLLSLDAPLVAITWQDFLARCYPSLLRPPGRWVLALTVWAIYLADRLLDVRHPPAGNETTRHRFYRRHRGAAAALLMAVLLADLVTSLLWLRPAVFSNGLWVTAAVAFYLGVFAYLRVGISFWKQPLAATLFTIGVFLVAWTSIPNPVYILGWPALAFFALCLGNILLIENWDQGSPLARGWIGMVILAVACALLGNSRWYFAVASAALGLAALDLFNKKMSADARRVLADAVLLAPLLFLVR